MAKKESQTLGTEILEGLTELAETVKEGTPLRNKFTIRTVELDLHPSKYGPEEIKAFRATLGVSQGVLAQLLAVSVASVQAWEQGVRLPNPTVCRLLDIIKEQKDHWVKMFEDGMRVKKPQTT